MDSFSTSRPIAAPAEQVWALVRDFGNDAWMTISISVEGAGEGAVRTVHMPGNDVVELCERLDEEAMVMGYTLLSENPFPCTNYHATMTVRSTGPDTSELEWAATYDTEDQAAMEAGLGPFLGGSLKALRRHLEA